MWTTLLIVGLAVALFFPLRPIIKGITKRSSRKKPPPPASPLTFHGAMKSRGFNVKDIRDDYPDDKETLEVAFLAEKDFTVAYYFYLFEKAAKDGFNDRVAELKAEMGRMPVEKKSEDRYTALAQGKFYLVTRRELAVTVIVAGESGRGEAEEIAETLGF